MQATTTPIAAVTSRQAPAPQAPAPTQPRGRKPEAALEWIDRTMEALFGVDLRLILGMLMPMLLVIGLIISLVQSPSYWLVGLTLLVEIGCLVMVVTKLLTMLEDPDESPAS